MGLLANPRPQEQRSSYSPPNKLYSHWHPKFETTICFPRFSVRIRYDSREIADLMESILGYLPTSRTSSTNHVMDIITNTPDKGYLIITDNKTVETAQTPMDSAVMAFREITELACRRENWLVVLHAGVVAWKEQGIIFPSSGGAGKTTLTAALIQHGFDYLNDDVTPVERSTGKLIPAPMSLCIKSGSWPLLQPFYPELEQLQIFGRNNMQVKYLPPPASSTSASCYATRYLIIPCCQEGADPILQKVSPAEGLKAVIEGESLLPEPLKPSDIRELVSWQAS